jgi:hypothetical protein
MDWRLRKSTEVFLSTTGLSVTPRIGDAESGTPGWRARAVRNRPAALLRVEHKSTVRVDDDQSE